MVQGPDLARQLIVFGLQAGGYKLVGSSLWAVGSSGSSHYVVPGWQAGLLLPGTDAVASAVDLSGCLDAPPGTCQVHPQLTLVAAWGCFHHAGQVVV